MSVQRMLLVGSTVFAQAIAFSGSAIAQEESFDLELNNAADVEGNCRLTFVAANNTSFGLTTTSYEVAIFDGEGRVSDLLVLEFGDLPVQKTKVVQFDLPEKQCEDISRIVVNSAAECISGDDSQGVCMSAISTSTRTAIEFGI